MSRAHRPHIVLLVVDSLRARSLAPSTGRASTPFLNRLTERTLTFRRAYAAECWTLPAHLSMFTGLLPSQHGAHFQSMSYSGAAPTIAELARAAGYDTEVITRNSLFDGTVPGATRGFGRLSRLLAPLPARGRLFHFVLALAKPRVRRALRDSGFFTGDQRCRHDFIETVARMGLPFDRSVLEHAAARLRAGRQSGRPQFLFVNCYDVHAPYSPTETSPLLPWSSPAGIAENLRLAVALPKVSGHGYLKSGFRLSLANQRMLRRRYETAIALMDAKLAAFWQDLEASGVLHDTVVILTSDHGEAFGEHALYFHDASVYGVHLHVPLWIHHPALAPAVIDEVVSTRALFPLLAAIVGGEPLTDTVLAEAHRQEHPVALAEHFHYPHLAQVLPRYRRNQAVAIVGRYAFAMRGRETALYDLRDDPHQHRPMPSSIGDFAARLADERLPAAAARSALEHLRYWEARPQ